MTHRPNHRFLFFSKFIFGQGLYLKHNSLPGISDTLELNCAFGIDAYSWENVKGSHREDNKKNVCYDKAKNSMGQGSYTVCYCDTYMCNDATSALSRQWVWISVLVTVYGMALNS